MNIYHHRWSLVEPGGKRQRTKGTSSSWFPEKSNCFFLEGRSRCTQSKIPPMLYTGPVSQGGAQSVSSLSLHLVAQRNKPDLTVFPHGFPENLVQSPEKGLDQDGSLA